MSTEQTPDINARLEKILADVSDAIDDAITGAIDAPDPLAKTQVLSEGYAKILRLMLPCATVDGLHLPNPDDVPAHVEKMTVHEYACGTGAFLVNPPLAIHGGADGTEDAPRDAAGTVPRDGSRRSIKDATAVFKAKGAARVVHTNYLGVEQFLVITPHVCANGEVSNEIVITENGRVIFDGFSYVGMAKTWNMGCRAFREYQLMRFHAVRYRRNRAAAAAPVSAAPRGAEAAETRARPINPEDDE